MIFWKHFNGKIRYFKCLDSLLCFVVLLKLLTILLNSINFRAYTPSCLFFTLVCKGGNRRTLSEYTRIYWPQTKYRKLFSKYCKNNEIGLMFTYRSFDSSHTGYWGCKRKLTSRGVMVAYSNWSGGYVSREVDLGGPFTSHGSTTTRQRTFVLINGANL